LKKKQQYQIRKIDYAKRTEQYTVRDITELDNLGSKKQRFGFIKFLLFSIIIVGASFYGFSYFNYSPKADVFEINKGVLKALSNGKNYSVEDNVNDDYYGISIMIDSGKRRGLVSPEHLTSIRYLQSRLKRELKIDSISIADYIIRLNNISFREKANSSKIPLNKNTIIQFFFLLQNTDINFMNFAGADLSMSYVYLKKDRSRDVSSLKSSINSILKKYSKENKLKVVIDYKDSSGKITPLKNIKYQYYNFIIDPEN
jgi:hypothetical protein